MRLQVLHQAQPLLLFSKAIIGISCIHLPLKSMYWERGSDIQQSASLHRRDITYPSTSPLNGRNLGEQLQVYSLRIAMICHSLSQDVVQLICGQYLPCSLNS